MKKFLVFLCAIFFAFPVMACTSDEIDVLGDGTQCETAKFTLTTVASATNFSFTLSAKGTFYVDCGNNGILTSSSPTNYPVNGKIVNRTYGTDNITYTCTWETYATKTIRFGGAATDYNTGITTATISFSNDPAKVASISGSLGQMFGAVNSGRIPRFCQTFYECTRLTSIPSGLFSNINTSSATDTSYMFSQTFYKCSGLTGAVPDGLFDFIDTSSSTDTSYMFNRTFYGCNKLTSMPIRLFSGINISKSTNTNGMFLRTFYNCNSLTRVTNGNTSTTYIPAIFLNNIASASNNVAQNMFISTALASPCPSGTTDTTPSLFSDAGKPWCEQLPGVDCVAGQYLPANVSVCAQCPINNICVGGTYLINKPTNQGIVACTAPTPYAPTGSSVCYPHILHVGDSNVYLKSTKQTTPSLNFRIGNDIFYANMTTVRTKMNKDSEHYFHAQWENNHYYVCDDTTCPQ